MIHTFMFQNHNHIIKFYPSADDFTQAPLVMLVTNIMSALDLQKAFDSDFFSCARCEAHCE